MADKDRIISPDEAGDETAFDLNLRPGSIDEFVGQYGEAVLMAPPKRGFNLAGYFVPSIAILVAGLLIVPAMSAGATDGLYFRNLGVPSYGVSGLFMHPKDNYAHGLNERVPVAVFDGALIQWHSLLTDLAR